VFRGLLTACFVALALTLGALAPVYAADPTPAATAGASPVFLDELDPRAGEGASRGGAPFLALLIVVGLGTTVAAATFVYARMSRRA
jgi:hypothetical protein